MFSQVHPAGESGGFRLQRDEFPASHHRRSASGSTCAESHENGDSESSHGHFKIAVDLALQLRGSRDFASRDDYQTFLRQVLDKHNAARRERHAEEVALLRPLPAARLECRPCLVVTVAIDRLMHRNREARRAIMASGSRGDALPARQKERQAALRCCSLSASALEPFGTVLRQLGSLSWLR